MLTTNLQNTPYLPRQRNFPLDNAQVLGIELDKSYIEIAQRVNERTIGVYAVNYPIITGEQWFLIGQPFKQQSLRQVFSFTATTSITHNINVSNVTLFTKMYGQYTDGTNWYGLIAATNVGITGQITFYITPTQIVFVVDAAAPALTQGYIILEWLSKGGTINS